MKKKIIVLLLCVLTLLSAVSCAKEKYDLLYTVENEGITFSVRGSGTRARQIVVKEGDTILFHEKVKIDSNVGTRGGNYGFELIDLNFDGAMDFMIVDDVAGDCVSYLCWIRDPESKAYKKSEELSGLCNIKTNPEKKSIFTFAHTFKREEAYLDVPEATITSDITTKYVWKDGVVLPSVQISLTYYSETDAYCISVAYYDEATGKFSIDNTKEDWIFTQEEFEQYDLSELYYFK